MFRSLRKPVLLACLLLLAATAVVWPSDAAADCPETGCSALALQILNLTYNGQPRVTFRTDHSSGLGVGDGASAYGNIQDTAAGLKAKTSSYRNGSLGGGQYWGGASSIWLTKRMLNGLYYVGSAYRIRVGEMAGGAHSNGSYHYRDNLGRAFDIDTINGYSYGNNTAEFQRLANAIGAYCKQLGSNPNDTFYPANDSLHQDHVHCSWQ
jgi:hypothetical protein